MTNMEKALQEISSFKDRNYTEIALPLSNGKGFGKIARFKYKASDDLRMPLVISPHIQTIGNPLLTRQGVYFMSDIGYVIRAYIPTTEDSDIAIWQEEILPSFRRKADDCLFEYSLKQPSSKLTTHTDAPPIITLLQEQVNISYSWVAGRNNSYLSVDGQKANLLDPIVPQFVENAYTEYSKKLLENLEISESGDYISTISDIRKDKWYREERPGWGRVLRSRLIPHVIFSERPFSYYDMLHFSTAIPINTSVYQAHGGIKTEEALWEWCFDLFNQRNLEQYNITTEGSFEEYFTESHDKTAFYTCEKSYNPRLLEFYFSGLRSPSPLNEFRGYYNVIEYLFEGKPENEEIRNVIERYITKDRLIKFLTTEISAEVLNHFLSYRDAIGQAHVELLTIDGTDIRSVVAKRIYQFRNAIFHSKKTRNGQLNNNIRPTTKEEYQVVAMEVKLLNMIAQEIILQVDFDV